MEQGIVTAVAAMTNRGRGFHAHVAFFFDGSRVHGDVYKAQLIGELWERVTLRRGCYDSCNHDKEEKYEDQLGIGMIHRDDSKCAAISIAPWLTWSKMISTSGCVPEGAVRCVGANRFGSR